ncbi:winged helix-turn-helix domain-containing tetratricopeptide repeat protein [Rhizobium leguminosarum]|uniref:winged helix-turn-helix domain-containing tetratricopeptide repeat protein n=1 Tax=Rhizobium leguminosarum TaxID=384 RepID=UPI000361E243|nr:tetratricopeptide repeat protein [Rhizobium leguminosarum]MBB4331334.1 TolB-like protein/Tfp pilus assembly protein PilF [Rhizobium leguminosarum]MBB4356674.1 TolB-like protein/Tfp pilus assembly protein PilF [Rhizobium leguminosarum]MBB4465657.1 TolB-like protein/Tfp pilus assembly protein PilF [Rhizobium leguminosarum]MBB4472325.1 TolB-like protein/Tfp pilus assembly protein PilF [Rhizobium leguminosarum]MBB4546480.1 TolB-like protein/Tfp pilus assembly protein PilF [Rhizobium leguminosar
MGSSTLSFGPFLYDPVTGSLWREGKSIATGPRPAALLGLLLEAEGRAVTKADLMDRAWPGLAVEEGNLTVQIATLRKILGARPDGTEWIVTVPRVGYRLPRRDDAGMAPVAPQPPSVAVLPFVNLGGDVDQDYFADGVVTEIITALARFRSFSVVSRHSAFIYKGRSIDVRQVAAELGVRYVLEGSIRREGGQVRINVQLVDGVTATNLWADHFEDGISHIFAFQDHITERVASIVEPAIEIAEIQRSRRDRPNSPAVYDLYLRALAAIIDESIESNAAAYALLQEALAMEPENAMLLSHAAWALEHRITMGWPRLGTDDKAECISLARRGLQHSAGDPRVMAHCGMALLQTGKDYEGGMAVLEAAAAANPNDLLVAACSGIAALHCGDIEQALERLHRAVKLGPRDPDARFSLTGIAMAELFRGNYEAAISYASRSLALNAHFDPTYWMLIAAHAHLGNMEQARQFLHALEAMAPDVTLEGILAGQPAKDPLRFAPVLEGLARAGMRPRL